MGGQGDAISCTGLLVKTENSEEVTRQETVSLELNTSEPRNTWQPGEDHSLLLRSVHKYRR